MRGGAEARPGHIYHSISRFVAREFFVASAVERRTYLSLIGRDIMQSDWRCFSFAVMSSHIHLGLVAGHVPLADWLRDTHTDFANWINSRNERIGAVFVRGPNFIEFQRAGVAPLINYIHNNPVRAGVVGHPRDSDWTSHRMYCGLTRPLPWLDIQLGIELSGFASVESLEAWMTSIQMGRHELDTFRTEPLRLGRPRLVLGEQPPERLTLLRRDKLHELIMCNGDDSIAEAA